MKLRKFHIRKRAFNIVIIGNHGNHQICLDTHSVNMLQHKYLQVTIYDAMHQTELTNKYDFQTNPQLLYTFGLTRNKQEKLNICGIG